MPQGVVVRCSVECEDVICLLCLRAAAFARNISLPLPYLFPVPPHEQHQRRLPQRRAQSIVTCVMCWVCGVLGQIKRGRQSGADRKNTESEHHAGVKPSTSSFLAGIPKARYDLNAARRVLPMSFFSVARLLSTYLMQRTIWECIPTSPSSPSPSTEKASWARLA